jgi:glycosyltransferase involved in cell wall biosynthesis
MVPRPKVSIIIPCYNAARTLPATLASARAQSLREIEIIAVDDGSTDTTGAVLADVAKAEPRITIVRRSNGGLAAARNTGIDAARGDVIALLDADDVIDPDYLARHVANLEAHALDLSYARVRYIDADGRPTGKSTRPPLAGLKAEDFLVSNPCTAFLVFRRDLIARVGAFDPAYRRLEDQEWLFRAVHRGATLRGVDATLAGYRITPGSLSSNVAAMEQAFETLLETARREAPELVARHEATARARMLKYCARRVLDHGQDTHRARRLMLRAVAAAPGACFRDTKSTVAMLAAAFIPGMARVIYGAGLLGARGAS